MRRHLRSWLSVPLKASDEYLGFLSISHRVDPFTFAAGRWARQHHDDAEVRPSHAADDEGRIPEEGSE
jgi:hypothetical protein